jgi:hypothetical protein
MHHGAGRARELYFGFDREHFFLRLDFAEGKAPGPESSLAVELLAPRPARLEVRGLGPGARPVLRSPAQGGGEPEAGGEELAGARCVVGSILELGVPFSALGLSAGDAVELVVHLLEAGQLAETLPDSDLVRFLVPDASFADSMWSA